jgi:pilus assembly protein Flp/PilA
VKFTESVSDYRFPGLNKYIGANMKTQIQTFLKDETGVTAIEYGLIAGLVVAGILVSVTSIGTSLTTVFSNVATAATNAATNSTPH